jgi:class 3 adenylate cyclase/tetratricopeptide (TPR) repeat protein
MQAVACVDCKAANPAGSKFCNQCGTSLAKPGAAEVRQITILFSDLVGSTALARALDAETFRDLLNEYQAICREIVAGLGGHVAQYLGDGVMIYFGFPEAHEHDAQRAARAALSIIERTKTLGRRLDLEPSQAPQVRMGIHTGVVVVAQIGTAHQLLALGETPSLASRLQHVAEPNTVAISDSTRRLISPQFEVVSRGIQTFNGFPDAVAVYQLLGEAPGLRLSLAVGMKAPPPVGRERELAELTAIWEAATEESRARVVLLTGEAGIGKSRLVEALLQSIGGGCQVAEGYCRQERQSAAFSPFAQALDSVAGLSGLADSPAKLSRLREHFLGLGVDAQTATTFAPMLGLPLEESDSLSELGLQIRRQNIMQGLVHWLRGLASSTPVLVLLEDLQWADPSTLEFLRGFLAAQVRAPILVVATCRPELLGSGAVDDFEHIILGKLPAQLAELLVAHATHDRPLPREVVTRILELTDGVPLYIEEVTKAILESGALRLVDGRYELSGSLPDGVLPATVRDSLMARLDGTGDGRAIAQLAAAIGREFSDELLRAVALMDDVPLGVALRALIQAQLIHVEQSERGLVYRFKHALIQEAAYQSLLRSKRQQYHHRIASVLHDQFPEVAGAQPDLIAQHHAKASLPDQAATYYARAGTLAFETQAYVEASSHFDNALNQLSKLRAEPERDRRELAVLSLRGLPLLMTRGYASPQVAAVYQRALELCVSVEPPVRVLYGVYVVHNVRGDREATNRLASEFEKIARHSSSRSERLIAHAAVGARDFWQGSFVEAIRGLQMAVACFDRSMLTSLPREYGHDNALYGHLMLLWSQVMAGQVGDAQATWNQLWEITESTQAPYLTVMALSFGAAIARDLGDHARAMELSSRGVELASKYQLIFWLALAHMQRGSAACMSSKQSESEGLQELERGLAIFRATGASLPLPYYLSYLVEACLVSGATAKGIATVEEALALTAKNLDRNCEPELWRLKAELLLQRGEPVSTVEVLLWRALDRARADGAGLWELRTAMSLGRILSDQGNWQQGHEILEAACARIVGAEPPVLRLARGLSRQLAAQAPSSRLVASAG